MPSELHTHAGVKSHQHDHERCISHHGRLPRRFELPLVQGVEESPDLSFLLRKSIEQVEQKRKK